MQITVSTSPVEQTAGALGVIVFEAAPDPSVTEQSGWLAELRTSGEFTGKLYETATLHRPSELAASRLVLVGGGKRETFSAFEARRAAGALVRALKPKGVHKIALLLDGAGAELVSAAVEGAIVGAWEPDKYKTDPKKSEKWIDGFTVVVPDGDAAALRAAAERGRIVAEAQNFTRDLANEPANKLKPADLVQAALSVAQEIGLECDVLDRDAMAALGMGALLGVAQGSDNPPFLIVLKYRPASFSGGDHLALVGKGVTFDTGGISIKPADGMEKMKYDMAGAAAVIGAMKAIGQLRPAIPVTAYVPTVENMLNGNAQRPGDIVTSLAGKTIEVINTDAEGRLILADALTYANRGGATHIVDAATLTGAIGVALGQYNMGAFTNNQEFLEHFLTAARSAGEKTWQLPLDEEYKEYLKSAVADLPNVGGRPGGSITAAWFLREFADPTPWIHLDIAATAWLDDPKAWISKGPTGVAVRSFVQLTETWQ
jgi:leucyl aminopeptidase